MPSMPKLRRDLAGQVFGRLTAVSDAGSNGRDRLWFCRCQCGGSKVVSVGMLRQSRTRSCGCLNRETHTKHGSAHRGQWTRAYRAWRGMRVRCLNPKCVWYHRYGGRGITICDRWLSFEYFLADMGECPDGLTLDRINNDGNYEPSNCRWATWTQQRANRSDSRRAA